MMPEPGDDRAARPAGRGRLRASHADRDQVVDILKDAFVQGRLTKDEFDARLSQALASRTHADLGALTADLPAVRPPRKSVQARPQRPADPAVKRGARVIAVATSFTGGLWAAALLTQSDSPVMATVVWTVTLIWFGMVLLAGSVMLESRHQQRSRGQLPPSRGGGGQPPRHAILTDPAGSPRPGDHGLWHIAEASSPLPVAQG
jgi:hypothetical protein